MSDFQIVYAGLRTEYPSKGMLMVGLDSGLFRLLPVGIDGTFLAADSNQTEGVSWQTKTGSPGEGAPIDAQYVVVSLDEDLTDERRLRVDTDFFSLTDAGANNDITIGFEDFPAASILVNPDQTNPGPPEFLAIGANTVLARLDGADVKAQKITTPLVQDAAITYAKMQAVSAASVLLGRGTAGGSAVREITLGTGLTMSGNELSASGGSGITDGDKGDITVSGGGTNWQIDAGVVGTTELADLAVTTGKINDLAVTTGKLADLGVTTGKIADAAVTNAKLANLATQRVIGRNTAGTGVPEAVTASQILSWIGATQGQILYYNGTAWTVLAPGTSGHFLKTNGAGANPAWAAAAGGGTPAGSDTQVQYNNAGAFGADSTFIFSSSSKQVTARIFNTEPAGSPSVGDRIGTFRFGDAFYSGSVIEMYVTYGTVENLFFGIGAGNPSHGGATSNIGIGRAALNAITSGAASNVAIGDQAGSSIAGEDDNTCLGKSADIVTGVEDAVALGADSIARTDGALAVGQRHLQMDPVGEGCGTVTLSGGTATVFNNKVTSSSIILHARQALGGTAGHLRIANIVANTSFDIVSSSAADTSVVGWMLIDPQ